MQLCIGAFASGDALDITFNSSYVFDESQWEYPEGYTITDDGMEKGSKNAKLLYKGASFNDKYEALYEVKFPYSSSATFIINYADSKNYQSIAFNPQFDQVIVQSMKNGYLKGVKEAKPGIEIKATQWYKIRIISNGGEGISFYISDSEKEYKIFEDVYVEEYSAGGYVGYDSKNNTLKIKGLKVTPLGAKDFVKPAEPEQTQIPAVSEPEEIPVKKEEVAGMYDDGILKLVTALGIIPEEYTEKGWDYVTKDSLADIMTRLNVYIEGGEEYVTLNEGLEAMLSALGYGKYLTDSFKKVKTSVKNRIRTGSKIKDHEQIVYHDLAGIIYNSLEEKVLDYRGEYGYKAVLSTRPGYTLMSEVLEIDVAEGQVTDNYLSAATGETGYGLTMLNIGDKDLYYNSELHNIYNYLGRYVKAYYRVDDYSGHGEILWLEYHNKEEILEISAEDFISYNKYKITYDKNGKTKTEDFLPASKIIYNGKAVKSYSADMFKFENGSIKLVRYSGGEYDTVIITDYEDFVINSVDSENGKIYSKVSYRYSKDGNHMLEIPDSIKYEIRDTDGKLMKLEELKADDILSVIKNDELFLITVSRNIMKFFDIYSTRNDDNGRKIISGSGGTVELSEYEVSSYCSEAAAVRELEPGQTVDLYINAFGKCVWAKFVVSQESFTGVLVKTIWAEDDEALKLHIFKQDGMPVAYDAAEKITVFDEDGNKRRLDAKAAYDVLKNKNVIVTYFVNDADEVRYIELPASSFKEGSPNAISLLADENMTFSTGGYFAEKYFFADNMKTFAVSSSEKDNMFRYSLISTWSLQNASKFDMKVYGTDNDIFVNYAILYDVQKSDFPSNQGKAAVVTDISTELYEDEPCVKITCFNGAETVIYADKEVVENAADPFSYMSGEQFVTRELKKGDIIRYGVDSVTGKAKRIIIHYSAAEPHPESGNYGWIVGATNALSEDSGKTNPYCYQIASGYENLSFDKNVYTAKFDSYSKFRVTQGCVFRKVNSVLELTTEDLGARNGGYSAIDSDNYFTLRVKASTGTNVLVSLDRSGGNVKAKATSAKLAQIKSYEEVGEECTRFVRIQNNFGTMTFFINEDK